MIAVLVAFGVPVMVGLVLLCAGWFYQGWCEGRERAAAVPVYGPAALDYLAARDAADVVAEAEALLNRSGGDS